eukprot:TRINITY_DN5117_c0_g6_i1.p1 TRINITY_DN5117_c0_g6~~TRINITY_DN5117_c0_g6_i1.p1  ORF type:complete len:581 (-),score=13.16 TRINITY_DN5117_c0_g6_i1:1442-3184(-)
MRFLRLNFLIQQFLSCCACLNIPECGELEDIRWDNQCFQSHIKQHGPVLRIKNLMVYDRKLYLLVPHETDVLKLRTYQQKLLNFIKEEHDVRLVNISRSPFMFGKQGKRFEIKRVVSYDYGLLLLKENVKRHVYEVWRDYPCLLDYVPSATIYWMLCRQLGICTFSTGVRDQILFMSTIYNQSHVDWDNGINVQCFTANDILPILHPSQYHARTLFMIRNVVVLSPNLNQSELNPFPRGSNILGDSIKQQCVQQGYGYDKYNRIQDDKRYNISICGRFKNEAKYLLEWIAYHVNIGIDHFVMYNDASSDSYVEVLAPLIESGLVTLYQRENLSLIWEIGYHESVMKHCSDNHMAQSQWLLSLDLDEFVVIKEDNKFRTLSGWLDKNSIAKSGTGIIHLAREALAGHSDPIKQSQLVTAEIFYKHQQTNDSHPKSSKQGIKSLVNTNGLDRLVIHHALTYYPVVRNSLLEDKLKCEKGEGKIHNCDTISEVSIYHYIVRSMEDCQFKAHNKNWTNNWRLGDGQKFCDSYVYGFDQDPANWTVDYTLANPEVTKQTCARMKELNNVWYTQKSLCGYYSSLFQ